MQTEPPSKSSGYIESKTSDSQYKFRLTEKKYFLF